MALPGLPPKGIGIKAMAALSFFAPAKLPNPFFKSLEEIETQETPGASLVSEISFEANSWELTEKAHSSLERLVRDIHGYKRIDEIRILSWADIDSPAIARRKLTKRDFELAEKRASIIQEFLSARLKAPRADVHIMAQNKPMLGEFINSIGKSMDTRIKRALELAGITVNGHKTLFSQKASKAIVIAALSDGDFDDGLDDSFGDMFVDTDPSGSVAS